MTDLETRQKITKIFARAAKRDSGIATPYFAKLSETVKKIFANELSEYESFTIRLPWDEGSFGEHMRMMNKYYRFSNSIKEAASLESEIATMAKTDAKAAQSVNLVDRAIKKEIASTRGISGTGS